jgi:hypothetical protein
MCAAAPVLGAVAGLLLGSQMMKQPKGAPKVSEASTTPAPAPQAPVLPSPAEQQGQMQAARANQDQKRQLLAQTNSTTPLGLLSPATTSKKTLLGG